MSRKIVIMIDVMIIRIALRMIDPRYTAKSGAPNPIFISISLRIQVRYRLNPTIQIATIDSTIAIIYKLCLIFSPQLSHAAL